MIEFEECYHLTTPPAAAEHEHEHGHGHEHEHGDQVDGAAVAQRKRLVVALDLCSIAIGVAEARLASIRAEQAKDEHAKAKGTTYVPARGRLSA